MLTKEITYEDVNGQMRTETFNFNLSESELSEFAFSEDGGLAGVMQKIIQQQDVPKIMMYFKKIILMAYGEKSADGRRFIKSPELSKAFSETGAYDKLFMELFQSGEKANEFFKGIIPASMRAQIESEEGKNAIEQAKARANITALPTAKV